MLKKTVCIKAYFISMFFFTAALLYSGTAGDDFWFMLSKNNAGFGNQYLVVSSLGGAQVTVEIPGMAFSSSFTVAPASTTTAALPLGSFAALNDGVDQKGIHVYSTGDIVLHAFSYALNTSDMALVAPVTALGTDYIVMAFRDYVGAGGTQFGIAAAYDGTNVTIIPNMTAGSRTAGVPYGVTLSAGDTYQLYNAGGDFTGTQIHSDKPVFVIGGNRCVGIPIASNSCDCIFEQIPDVKTWGKQYASGPIAQRSTGDVFVILAAYDSTLVSINGVPAAALDKGQHYETILSQPAYFSSNNPVLIGQYEGSYTVDPSRMGDPDMILLTPFEQWLDSYVIGVPSNIAIIGEYDYNYLNVTVENSSVSGVVLDGAAVPAAVFTPVPGGIYSAAQLQVGTGTHVIDAPSAIGVIVYGMREADSYGAQAGGGFKDLLSTPTATATSTMTATCTFTATNTPTVTATGTATATVTPTPGFCLELKGVFPHPAVYDANIVFRLCRDSKVSLRIYTVSGELFYEAQANGVQGVNTMHWDIKNNRSKPVATGVFIYSLEAVSGTEKGMVWDKVAVVK